MSARNAGWLLMAAAGMLPAWAGCARQAESSDTTRASMEAPRNVRIMEVEEISLSELLGISGPMKAIQAADISTEEAGVVQALPSDKGSSVRKGDVLVQLDRGLLAAELDAAKADRELTSYNESRTRALFEENSVSGQEMLQAATALKRAQAAEDAAQIRYERAAVKAPFSGIVTERYVEIGEYILPGMPVARVVDPYVLKLMASVGERDVARISEGALVEVYQDGVSGPAEGVVEWVGFEADPGTGKFPVEIHIPNPDLRLRPGVVGRASVVREVHDGVVGIPRDAVVMSDRGPTVFVLENGMASRREVVLGPDQGMMVVVTRGVRTGDQLIVRGQRDVLDGDAVQVREVARDHDGTMDHDPDEVRHSAEASRDASGGAESLRHASGNAGALGPAPGEGEGTAR